MNTIKSAAVIKAVNLDQEIQTPQFIMIKKILLIFSISYLHFHHDSLAQTIAGGSLHSMSICSDSTVMSWGRNQNGQLGIGNNLNSNVPLPVNSLTRITAIAACGDHSLALKNDSTVWAWGVNRQHNVD